MQHCSSFIIEPNFDVHLQMNNQFATNLTSIIWHWHIFVDFLFSRVDFCRLVKIAIQFIFMKILWINPYFEMNAKFTFHSKSLTLHSSTFLFTLLPLGSIFFCITNFSAGFLSFNLLLSNFCSHFVRTIFPMTSITLIWTSIHTGQSTIKQHPFMHWLRKIKMAN